MDWYPYCDDAFEHAKKEDKILFISIGYSTCHWCHVMARESFSDDETAKFMNEHFVSVKIDREEYPDIDRIYQEAYQLMYRRGGGWPLTVYAFPDGNPFFIGTYFPKDPAYGMNAFMEVNRSIVDAWENRRDELIKASQSLRGGLIQFNEYNIKKGKLDDTLYDLEVNRLEERFDGEYGGIGTAPKFPQVAAMRFLLQQGIYKKREDIAEFVRFTYHKMSMGGIYDQIGGGFSRYSVDRYWMIPHFEKMLYDNAGLLLLGAELRTALGDRFSEWVIYDVITWLNREMRDHRHIYYSAMNAESEGMEGKYYVWTLDEIQTILGDLTKYAIYRYNITEKGNFKDPHHPQMSGLNVLTIKHTIASCAKYFNLSEQEMVDKLNIIRTKLFEYRSKREEPSTDTKMIVSWNAYLAIAFFMVAESILFKDASQYAEDILEFILKQQIVDNKYLKRIYHKKINDQKDSSAMGTLDDYSYLIAALIQAFEYTDKWYYIVYAEKILKMADNIFYENDLYYFNSSESDIRVIQATDESMPSALAIMVNNLFKLGKYLENNDYVLRGEKITEKFAGNFGKIPGAMNQFMLSAIPYIHYPIEIVITDAEGTDLDTAFYGLYLPNRLIYRWNNRNKNDGRPIWHVIEERAIGKPTVYICHGQTCSLPMHTNNEVREYLSSIIKDY